LRGQFRRVGDDRDERLSASEVADAGCGDTSNEVTVRFVDAPAGMRSGVSQAAGPARLALCTNYAMAAPF
jgi:hypothetical protein